MLPDFPPHGEVQQIVFVVVLLNPPQRATASARRVMPVARATVNRGRCNDDRVRKSEDDIRDGANLQLRYSAF
jgi:hypothetical protein